MAESTANVPAQTDGRFVKGQSGNPAGRPPNSRGTLKQLQRDMEIAIREHLGIEKVRKIVNKMAEMAELGNVAAAKLILDKVIANASDSEDAGDNGRTVVFQIVNATFAAQQKEQKQLDQPAIDVPVIEIQPVQEEHV